MKIIINLLFICPSQDMYKHNYSHISNIDHTPDQDSSFYHVNYQILDYNINLLKDVIDKIVCLFFENTNIKRKNFCINIEIDNSYRQLIESFMNLIEYLTNILVSLKSTNKNIYKEFYLLTHHMADYKKMGINKFMISFFKELRSLKGSVDWIEEIKEMSSRYERNIEYVVDIIETNKIKEYGYELYYEDLIKDKKYSYDLTVDDKYEGTPLKKRCITKMSNCKEEINFDNSEFEMSSCGLFSIIDTPIENTKEKINTKEKVHKKEKINIKEKTNTREKVHKKEKTNTKEKINTKAKINIKEKINMKIDNKENKKIRIKSTIKKTYTKKNNIKKNNTKENNILNKKVDYNIEKFNSKELEVKYCKFLDLPQNVVKVAEASFSEVFKFGNLIYKIIPLGNKTMTTVEDFFREARILKILKGEEGVSKLREVLMVTGSYPLNYLKAWDKFGYVENPRPDFYKVDQLFGILVIEDGGICLENYKFRSVNEIEKIIHQISSILSLLEQKYNLEHRDLHWGNILIKRGRIQIIDFGICRMKYNREVIYKDLNEYEWIFQGDEEVDEQFGIYKKMKSISRSDWESFYPFTNILWMRYLIKRLFDQIKIKKSRDLKYEYLEILKGSVSISDYYTKIVKRK